MTIVVGGIRRHSSSQTDKSMKNGVDGVWLSQKVASSGAGLIDGWFVGLNVEQNARAEKGLLREYKMEMIFIA